MRGVSTKQRITDYLRYHNRLVSGSELEGCAEAWQTKASVISRRARELAYEGKIDRTLSNRRTVQYSARPKQFTTATEANNFIKELA